MPNQVDAQAFQSSPYTDDALYESLKAMGLAYCNARSFGQSKQEALNAATNDFYWTLEQKIGERFSMELLRAKKTDDFYRIQIKAIKEVIRMSCPSQRSDFEY